MRNAFAVLVAIFLISFIGKDVSADRAARDNVARMKSTSAPTNSATRLVCFRNATKGNFGVSVQARACRQNSYNCGGWKKLSLAHGQTDSVLVYGSFEGVKKLYFEYEYQGGDGRGGRGKDKGGYINSKIKYGDLSYCDGRTVFFCGKTSVFATNGVAASTDHSCR